MKKILTGVAIVTSLFSATAVFAEPAVQPGQTLESLSQAQVTTTVNGQPGSLQQLMQSGQYQPVATPSFQQQQPAPADQAPADDESPAPTN